MDSCQQWSYTCCCEVLRKAFKKQIESGRKDKHTIQGRLYVYQTQVLIVKTVIRT